MNLRKLACLLLIAVAMVGCSNTETPPPPKVPTIYTTFYPTTYFTRRIAGSLANVICPLPADQDPITWMPDADTIAAYQRADLVIINGADFEKWVARVSLPPSKVVDSTRQLAKLHAERNRLITHSHGPNGQHDHEGIDGRMWINPNDARGQAADIYNALAKLLPDHAGTFLTNWTDLAADLNAIKASLAKLSVELKKRRPLAVHPVYKYLDVYYGWNIIDLDLKPEITISDELVAEIRKQIEDIKPRPRIILWDRQPAQVAADRLKKDLGLTSVVFSPCEHPPEQPGDYLTVMRDNIKRLQAVLSPE
jgi:zinc transport system substrate-binding protein